MATDFEKLVEKMKGQKTQTPMPPIPNATKSKDFPNVKSGENLDKGIIRNFENEKRQDLNVNGTFIPIPSSRNKPNADGIVPLKKGGKAKNKHPNW
jgi:hypothetical protein